MAPHAFYSASLSTLRFVERRSPTNRRFGPDADAMWRELRGHLTTSDRIDLLLRDGDVAFPGAFAARAIFLRRGVSEDDPFGAGWTSLSVNEADALWRQTVADTAPESVEGAVRRIAAAWDLPLRGVDVGRITPATKLVVAGPSAIAAVIIAFADGADLSFVDQITVVATPEGHRHLAASAAALLNASRAVRLLAPAVGAPAPAVDRAIVSEDADPVDQTWIGDHVRS